MLRKLILVVAGIPLAAAAWGLVEPRLILDERQEAMAVPGLPPEWEGREIALIADLQVGMWLSNKGMIERVADRVVERRPTALLIAGDFVYHPAGDIEGQLDTVERLLAPVLGAGIPTLAVLGNHDWSISRRHHRRPDEAVARRIRARLEEIGIQVLVNEALALTIDEGAAEPARGPEPAGALYLVGLGSRWAGRDDPARALAGVPADAPRVVFMHNPDSFPELPPSAAPLALAAHTHGGQFRVPFFPDWSWMSLVLEDEVQVDGWIDAGFGAPGNRLYVNRGIGFSRLPLRINAPPELTFFELGRPR